MGRYCLQNIACQMAYAPLVMSSSFMLGRNIANSTVGVVLALGNILAIAVQPWVSSTADSKRGLSISQLSLAASVGAAIAFAVGVISPGPVLTMASVIAVYMFIMNLSALVNSVSVYYVNRGAKITYGVARGLGSGAYAIVAGLLGVAAERFGPETYYLAGIGLSAVCAVAMLLMPTPKSVPPTTAPAGGEEGGDISYAAFAKGNPKFMLLMAGASLAFMMVTATSSYALPIMQSVGGGEAEMGFALALSGMLELPAMWGYALLERRFRASSLLMFSVVMLGVRGAVFCLAGNIPMLYAGFAMQLVTFGIWTPASVSYANLFFDERNKNKAVGMMALLSSFAGVIASPVAGWAIDAFGLRVMLYLMQALALAAVEIAAFGLQREEGRRP